MAYCLSSVTRSVYERRRLKMEHLLLVVSARNLLVIMKRTEGTANVTTATEARIMKKKVEVLSTTIVVTITMIGVATDLLRIGTMVKKRIESTPETTRTGIMVNLPRAMTEMMIGDVREIGKAAQEIGMMVREGKQEQEACQRKGTISRVTSGLKR